MVSPRFTLCLVGLLLVAATLFRLGLVELRGEEPRRAVIAVEMLDSGEFIVPHISGATYYNKPPVFNWAVAASLALFPGTSAWMVRLPSLLAFFLTGWLVYRLSARPLGQPAAVTAALMYLTGGELLFYGTVMTGEMDLFYSLIVLLQVVSIFHFMQARRWTALFVVSYALAAVGFLTKGLPSIAFQGLTIVGALVAFGHARRLADPRHLLGIGAFCIVTGGYFWLYSLQEPVLPFVVALFQEASQRTGLESKAGELVLGMLTFPFVVLKLLLPWSLLAVWLLRRSAWRDLWARPWTRFCLVFCAVNLPLYWFSGELRNRYLYMFFPFLMIPLAQAYFFERDRHVRLARWTDRGGACLLGALVIGALVVPWVDPLRASPGALAVGLAWAAAGIALLILHRRRSDLRLPVLALALVVARLAFDVVYLPAMNLSRVSGYPPHVARMLELADGAPIYLAGAGETWVREAAIGPIHLGAVSYTIPPRLTYQIPWHVARMGGTPLVWKPVPQPGDWCLLSAAQVDPATTTIRYGFHDHWIDRDLALVRWNRQAD